MRQSLAITLFLASIVAPSALFGRAQRPVPKRAVERIKRQVRQQILMLPYYNVFDNITFKVQGYNVTLAGNVTQPTLKHQAENVVKQIEGVNRVDNRIEVLPNSRMDDQLRLRLYHAIYGYAPLQKYSLAVIKPIRIIVRNGHVELAGVVDSEGDKNLVTMRAKSVSDVFSVKNNLKVVKP